MVVEKHFHLPNQTRFIAVFNNALLIVLLFLLRRPSGLYKFNPGTCVLDSTIWRICLNHHPLNRNAPHNIEILSCLQRATIYTCLVQKGIHEPHLNQHKMFIMQQKVLFNYGGEISIQDTDFPDPTKKVNVQIKIPSIQKH